MHPKMSVAVLNLSTVSLLDFLFFTDVFLFYIQCFILYLPLFILDMSIYLKVSLLAELKFRTKLTTAKTIRIQQTVV